MSTYDFQLYYWKDNELHTMPEDLIYPDSPCVGYLLYDSQDGTFGVWYHHDGYVRWQGIAGRHLPKAFRTSLLLLGLPTS